MAAQLALSPARTSFSPVSAGVGAQGFGSVGGSSFQGIGQQQSPFSQQAPFSQQTPFSQGQFQQSPFGQSGVGQVPFGQSQFGQSTPWTTQSPFGVVPGVTGAPWASQVPPLGPFASQLLQQNPYALLQNPYLYR
jgi:hypothetical protein